MTRREILRGAALLTLVAVTAYVGVVAGQRYRQWRRPAPPAVESDLVPGARFPSVSVLEPDGTPRDTAELTKGGAVVVFLRFDCSACGLALDDWREKIVAGSLRGVPVVGITTDPPAAVPAYREAKGVSFPIYSDPQLTFVQRHGVTAVPFIVVVAPGGDIKERAVGYREDLDLERFRRLAS